MMKGHIAKKGTRYYPVVFIGFDEKGKRKYKWYSGFSTKKEAQKFLTEKLHEINTSGYIEPSKQSFGEYLTSWLDYKSTQIRPGTYRKYEWLINHHIIPGLGRIELSKLQAIHLQQFYTKLQSDEVGLSKRSVLHSHLIIKQALKNAARSGFLYRNVADSVDPPKPARVEFKIWNEEEMNTFLKEARASRYFMFFLLALSTGMRLGELLALKWSDCNLEEGLLQVRRSYSYTGKGYELQNTKTAKGNRLIRLSPSVVSELKVHKQIQDSERNKAGSVWQEHGLVICTSVGTPVLQHNLRPLFFRLSERAGVPRIRIHDLRHTHASHMIQQGASPKVVQERLGHSDISVTLNTYTHILPGIQEAAALKFDELLHLDKHKNNGPQIDD